jgi:hypothetical protein
MQSRPREPVKRARYIGDQDPAAKDFSEVGSVRAGDDRIILRRIAQTFSRARVKPLQRGVTQAKADGKKKRPEDQEISDARQSARWDWR